MKRSLRRWQQRIAHVRKLNLLRIHWHTGWRSFSLRRIHGDRCKLLMTEPSGEWNRTMHIRPARIRSNQLERLIELGRDPESLNFPSYRRPHRWYW